MRPCGVYRLQLLVRVPRCVWWFQGGLRGLYLVVSGLRKSQEDPDGLKITQDVPRGPRGVQRAPKMYELSEGMHKMSKGAHVMLSWFKGI